MSRLTAITALFVLASCARPEKPASDSAAPTAVENTDAKAAMVSNAIAANPAGADSILKANGYTRESFESEMYAIAADSSRSAVYAAAKKP